jgi:hypothetical protein
MSKTVIIFNTVKTFNKYSLEQIGLIDYSEVLGNCLWTSYMSRYEDDSYMNVQSYPVWAEIKESVEKEDWSEVYKLGKKFTSKVVKTKDLEMHAECAIKSMMNMMRYDNLSAIVTSEKPKVIMQILADSINERTDDTSFAWDLKWKLASSDKENTIVMDFPNYKFKLIPCNNAYQYYNMENYYDELDFKMYDDKKLYEGKTMKKNRMTERFVAPKDWDFEDMLNDYGMEYLQENDSDNEPIDMESFDEFLDSPWEAVRSAFYGGRFGFDRDSFNPNDDYFRFNGYGNVESIPYLDDYLKDMIDEESFYDWCVEQGYFESDEDDE